MKKTIQTMFCLLLALAMAFALAACGSSGSAGAAPSGATAAGSSAQAAESEPSESAPQTDESAQSTLHESDVEIDYGSSALYTQEELTEAAEQIKTSFADWEGCELHSLRYAGDECNSEENLQWLNSLNEGATTPRSQSF